MTSAYFSYHYGNDAARAASARSAMALEADAPIAPPAWEELGWGGDTAVTRWVADRLRGKECLVVLIGSQTATRKWVKYEIKMAWESGRGVMGINIHNLFDAKGKPSAPGKNPFEDFAYGGVKLSELVKVYEPLGDNPQENLMHISGNAHIWAANAVAARRVPVA
jgi:hypothetical protein